MNTNWINKLSMGVCMFSLFLSSALADTPNNMNLTALDGSAIEAKSLDGKTILFVNVASKCGYTKQYDGLQKLYETYKDQNFVIIGVPCNQFGGQEPGTAEEIQTFCKLNYGVTFPLLEKQEVNGEKRSALYKELVGSSVGNNADIKWNFEKFLVDAEGNVVARFPSRVAPDAAELTTEIEKYLQKK